MKCLGPIPAVLVALTIVPGQAPRAAEAAPSIVTDRPSVANSSLVVPQGGFQMENGLLASNLGSNAVVDLPESLMRYGLLRPLDRLPTSIAFPAK
jgi:hypothetical protein